MSQKTHHLTAVAVLCGALFMGSAPAWAQDVVRPEPIRIGVLTDMSGNMAFASGKGSVEAAQMAIDDFYLKAPKMAPAVLVTADYQNRGDLAKHISEDWIDNQHVNVIVDVPNSSITSHMQDMFKAKGGLMLSSCPAMPQDDLCARPGLAWLYGQDVLNKNLIKALVAEQKKNWFIISSDDAYSQNILNAAKKQIAELGGFVAGEAQLGRRLIGMDSVLEQIKPGEADVVFMAFDRHDMMYLLKHWPDFKKPLPPFAFSGIYINDLDRQKTAIPAFYSIASFYWNQDEPTRKWAEEFASHNQGNMPTGIHAAVYSEVKHYLKTVQVNGLQSSNMLLASMKTEPLDVQPFGQSRIRGDGMLMHRLLLLRTKPVAERASKWDMFTIVRTVPASDVILPVEAKCN